MKSKKLAALVLTGMTMVSFGMGGGVARAEQTIESLSGEVAAVRTRVTEAERSVTDLQTNVDNLQTKVNNINVDGMSDKITENTNAIADEKTARENLETEMNNRTNNINRSIIETATNLQTNLKGVQEKIEENLKSVADMAQDGIGKANQEIHTNAGNIEQNKQDIEKNASAIAEIRNTVAYAECVSLTDEVGRINELYTRLDMRTYNDGGTYFIGENAETNPDKPVTIGQSLKALDNYLAIEINNRKWADAEQDKVIATVNQNVANGFTALNKTDLALQVKDAELQQNIDKEAKTREAADKKLQENIDKEAETREAADTKLQENITKEETARKDADTTLQKNITKEENARIAGDEALSDRIGQVETDTAKGIAKASALAALHPLDFDPSNKFALSAAGGFYKSEKSFALGAFYRPTQDVLFSIGTSVGSGDAAYNVGVTVKLGKSGKGKGTTDQNVAELYRMIGDLQRRIEQLEANHR